MCICRSTFEQIVKCPHSYHKKLICYIDNVCSLSFLAKIVCCTLYCILRYKEKIKKMYMCIQYVYMERDLNRNEGVSSE